MVRKLSPTLEAAVRDGEYTSLVEYLLASEAGFVQCQVIAATGGFGVVVNSTS